MQAIRIAYDNEETRVALGGPMGWVRIAAVDSRDGSPADTICNLFHHKHAIAFLAFVGERLVSVDAHGGIAAHRAEDGELLLHCDVGGEYTSAALSPETNTLFVFSNGSPHDVEVFAIDLATFEITYGPKTDALSVESRVFGLSETRAAFTFLDEEELSDEEAETWGDSERVREAWIEVDFATGDVVPRYLVGGTNSTFGDAPVFALDVPRGIGVRCA